MATEAQTSTTETEGMTLEEQRDHARKARRAAAARRRYHANVEESRERCKNSKQKQRKKDCAEFPTTSGPAHYDPQDYADEWMWLTYMGMRSDVIIEKSRPAREWFVERVLPLVTRSICSLCNTAFNPETAGSLTRCSNACTGRGI